MLELTTFVAGASIMAIEIVASRILAPFLGNSIVVWSSLIGVILMALSYGYLQGGVLADRNPSVANLSGILAAAAVLTACIAVGKNACLTGVSHIPDIRVSAILAEVVLFAPVSFVLAMVSPYVVRLKVKEMGSTGATVGRLYALSTLGSIVGTFGAGFYLLAVIGSTAILFCICGILFLASFLLSITAFRTARIAAVGITALCLYLTPRTSVPFIAGKHVFETDSHYNHWLVYEASDTGTKRPIRSLVTDRFARQSSVFTDGGNDLVLEYLRYFRMGNHFHPDARRTLLLGGGAFTYVGDFFRRNPGQSLDVVELDPALPGIAGRYFGLTPHTGLRVFTEDARVYLNRCTQQYDIVYLDTFGSAVAVPHYLTTEETAHRIYDSLSPDGVVMLNLVSAIDGHWGQFFRAEFATYRKVFPHVEVFKPDDRPGDFRNVLVAAFKSPAAPRLTSGDPEIQSYLSHRWTKPIENDMQTLTDDFAPVEVYLQSW